MFATRVGEVLPFFGEVFSNRGRTGVKIKISMGMFLGIFFLTEVRTGVKLEKLMGMILGIDFFIFDVAKIRHFGTIV